MHRIACRTEEHVLILLLKDQSELPCLLLNIGMHAYTHTWTYLIAQMDRFLSFFWRIDHRVAMVASFQSKLTTFAATSLLAALYTPAIYMYMYIPTHTHTHMHKRPFRHDMHECHRVDFVHTTCVLSPSGVCSRVKSRGSLMFPATIMLSVVNCLSSWQEDAARLFLCVCVCACACMYDYMSIYWCMYKHMYARPSPNVFST
jgi:hypothetical protein